MEISTSTTKKGRINILTDGEYQFTVPAFIWYRSPLFGQTEADGVSLEALRAEGQAYDAYEKGLRLLGLRAHGAEELRRKLRRDYPADAANDAITKLTESGLLNDVSFAEALAEELYRRKHYAPERIKAELTHRGVDAETAKNALNILDIDRKQGIIDIISKMRLPERISQKDLNRLIRRLLGAGYTMAEIREAVEVSDE